MAQQTAVNFLVNYMLENFHLTDESLKIFEQAKQMEKEQISKAWDSGDYAYFYSKETGREFENGEIYYNETYGK